MRKKLLAGMLVMAMAATFGGASITSLASDDDVTIEMTVWNGEWGETLDESMESFNSTHDGITLNITMAASEADYIATAAATNNWPDIFICTPWVQVQTLAESGLIMDLSDLDFVDRVYESALEAAMYDGKVYGYPANVEYLGVFYNKGLFEEAGIESVPTTRDEFEEVCEQLDAAGIQPLASSYKESWTLKHMFSVLVSTVVQDDMEGFIDSLNSGEGTFGVDGMDEAFACADIIKEYSGSNMMDCDSTSAFNALANEDAAMLITGEFSQAVIAAMDNPPDIGYFALPVSNDAEKNKAAADVGIVYAVSSQTENYDACVEVIDFLSDPDLENGYIHIVTTEAGDAPPAMPFEGGYECSSRDDYEVYANSGEVIPWVYQQYVNGFDVISGDIFQRYLAGAATSDEIIEELDSTYLEYLDQ